MYINFSADKMEDQAIDTSHKGTDTFVAALTSQVKREDVCNMVEAQEHM